LEIDLANPVEILFLEVEEIGSVHDARIVDEDVNVAQQVHGRGDQIVNVERLADIGLDEVNLAERREIASGAGALLPVDVGHHDAHAVTDRKSTRLNSSH